MFGEGKAKGANGLRFVPLALAGQMELLPLRKENFEREGVGGGFQLVFRCRSLPFGRRIGSFRHIAEDDTNRRPRFVQGDRGARPERHAPLRPVEGVLGTTAQSEENRENRFSARPYGATHRVFARSA